MATGRTAAPVIRALVVALTLAGCGAPRDYAAAEKGRWPRLHGRSGAGLAMRGVDRRSEDLFSDQAKSRNEALVIPLKTRSM